MSQQSRRRLVLAAVLAVGMLTGCAAGDGVAKSPTSTQAPDTAGPRAVEISKPLQRLEAQYGARIGVSVVDTETGATISYRADERFGYASTLKAFIAAGFLSAVSDEKRDEVITWTQRDIDAAGYSPTTSEHIGAGLALSQLAEAAVRDSDNTAANLILERIGGPAGLQEMLRQAGDNMSVVAHDEPDLNHFVPGATDDTTTPAVFTTGLRAYLTGTELDADDTATLLNWMSDNATGDPLIRAGAPDGWVVADKSGGAEGMRNDIAIVTPPNRAPIIISIFTAKTTPNVPYENATVADTARVVLDALR